jgi:hypothetical protein
VFDATGAAVSDVTIVDAGFAYGTSTVALADGSFIVTYDNPGSGNQVFAQRVNADGTLNGAA